MWFELFSILFGSGGIIYGAVTWFFSKRKRNNDFIQELQISINNLTSSYTDTLNKLVDVQKQNSRLLINQDRLEQQNAALLENQVGLISEIEKLRGENRKLLTKINELNKLLKNEKCTYPAHSDSAV